MSDPVLKQSKAFAWTVAETLKRAAKRLGVDPDRVTVVPEWVTERYLWRARLSTPGHAPVSNAYEDPVTAIRQLVSHQTKGGGAADGS